MHEMIEKFENEAETQLSGDQDLIQQLIPDAIPEDRNESYLKAFRQAEHHLKIMTPRIIDMKTNQFLRFKQKLLVQSMEHQPPK